MIRFAGSVFRSGRHWAVEVSVLDVVTQGRSKSDAYEMIADAIVELVDRPGFRVDVHPGRGDYFEVSSNDEVTLVSFCLRRQRMRSGLSLAEVAMKLGAKSRNSYARYEQGRSVPTIAKLSQLLSVVSPDRDFVLSESQV
ncbi:MAG: helix-turn-helix transcriptional regulator [Deltaproteobacteria bacterium]|nr:helix-turn-helix transcriptional regulator [Deltaproteobacteria bacterium]